MLIRFVLTRAIFLLTVGCCFSQTKKMVVWDKELNLPVSNAHVFLNDSLIGLTSYKGNIDIEKSESGIYSFSHISYQEKILEKETLILKDTLFLNSKVYQLDEVVLSNHNTKIYKAYFRQW